jgi:hypothetical protein
MSMSDNRFVVRISGLECSEKYRISEIIADALGEYGVYIIPDSGHGVVCPPNARSAVNGMWVQIEEIPGPVPNAPRDAGVA